MSYHDPSDPGIDHALNDLSRQVDSARRWAVDLEQRLAAVMALHRPLEFDFDWCAACGTAWPCPTHIAACTSSCADGEPCAAADPEPADTSGAAAIAGVVAGVAQAKKQGGRS